MKTITIPDLKKLGFYKYVETNKDEETGEVTKRISYRIDGINSFFRFLPNESVYKWYYVTVIGDGYNYVHLDIDNIPELMTCLQVFKIKNNFFK